jgi:hypothetical protein
MAKRMSGQKIVTPNMSVLAESAKAANSGGLPPVHLWNPPFCGDLDMRITRDGTWFYEGTPIGRAPLVRLFSTILKLEGGKYYLVTPVEKVGITVEDAPFVAVDFEVDSPGPDQRITFETNVGDHVTASAETPLRFAFNDATNEPAPYIEVRAGLEALIDRKSFYRLIDIGTRENVAGEDWFGLHSASQFFPIIRSADLT